DRASERSGADRPARARRHDAGQQEGAERARQPRSKPMTDELQLPSYVRTDGVHPPMFSPEYRSTQIRSPKQKLVTLPNWLTEVTGPRYAPTTPTAADADLTAGHAGEPLGERIILTGRVLDSDGRPVPDTLVEIWQANASGRYHHKVDDHPAPLDPNFDGGGRCMTDSH